MNSPAEPAALSPGLYIVATPIGNLGDMTFRAVETLKRAELIACEDSRVTGKLLHHFGIKRPMVRYNDHSKASDRDRLIVEMRDKAVALVSDAGTPLISDPGYKLVREARDAGIAVVTIPGASAVLAALTLAGLPTDRFLFCGFLPAKAKARGEELAGLAAIPATLVFYESGPRLSATLEAMVETLGDREAAVARELTKLHEECRTGHLSELAALYRDQPPKGEIAIVVEAPAKDTITADAQEVEAALREALASMPTGKAASAVAKRFQADRKSLYALALTLKTDADG